MIRGILKRGRGYVMEGSLRYITSVGIEDARMGQAGGRG